MAIRLTDASNAWTSKPVDYNDPKNAWLKNVAPAGSVSNGVLGYMGVKPQQYDQARALMAAGVPSLNNADRMSYLSDADIAKRQALARQGGSFLNGDALVAGGRGFQNTDTPGFSAGLGQANPNMPTFGGNNGSLPPGLSGATGATGAAGSAPSSGGGLVQNVNLGQYQQNPYLQQMGDVLTNRVTDNLNRNILPGIRSNAVAAGGFGGSRQGVIEANAMKDANQGISDALTGAYFQDFTNQMNRNLAQYGQNQNFYSNQRGQDLQQTQLGANLFNMGNQGFLSQGQGLYGLGGQQQQAPWNIVNNANAGLGQWSGYGTTTSANQGGGAQGFLGGALAGGQLGSFWGGTGSSPVSTPQPLNANYTLSSGGGVGLKPPTTWGG